MATNYSFLGEDLDDLLEPKGNFSAPSPDFDGFKINGVSMTNRFAAYNGAGWEKLFASTYLNNGSPIQACVKGFKPSNATNFYTISGGAGVGRRNVYITRTDSALTLSGDINVSFGPSSFRNGKVPMAIGILTCGGGAGRTAHKTDKDTYYYGGGGACIGWFILSFDGLTETPRLYLAGGGGSNEEGGNTVFYMGNTTLFYIEGGHTNAAGGNTSNPGDEARVYAEHPNLFSTNGEVLTTANFPHVAGCYGAAQSNNSYTTSALANVTFDLSDTARAYGTPTTSVPNNCGYGGGSLNGSMVSGGSNGTNGAGAGYNGSAGGGAAVYFFY